MTRAVEIAVERAFLNAPLTYSSDTSQTDELRVPVAHPGFYRVTGAVESDDKEGVDRARNDEVVSPPQRTRGTGKGRKPPPPQRGQKRRCQNVPRP